MSAVQRECNQWGRDGLWVNYTLSFVLINCEDVVYEGDLQTLDSATVACKVGTRSIMNVILSVS